MVDFQTVSLGAAICRKFFPIGIGFLGIEAVVYRMGKLSRLNFSFSLNRSTFAARPGGEIGRRTVFRSQRGKPCAGSNPVPGTKNPSSSMRGFYIYERFKLA